MNTTLYAAAEEVRQMLEQIDPDTGELPEGFESAREVVANKLEACAAFILANEAETAMVKHHAKSLLDKVNASQKRSDWLRKYVGTHMAACGLKDIKSSDGTFSIKHEIGRDVSVSIDDVSLLPLLSDEHVSWTCEPNKRAIKATLMEGGVVPGASLVRKDRLTIK